MTTDDVKIKISIEFVFGDRVIRTEEEMKMFIEEIKSDLDQLKISISPNVREIQSEIILGVDRVL